MSYFPPFCDAGYVPPTSLPPPILPPEKPGKKEETKEGAAYFPPCCDAGYVPPTSLPDRLTPFLEKKEET